MMKNTSPELSNLLARLNMIPEKSGLVFTDNLSCGFEERFALEAAGKYGHQRFISGDFLTGDLLFLRFIFMIVQKYIQMNQK